LFFYFFIFFAIFALFVPFIVISPSVPYFNRPNPPKRRRDVISSKEKIVFPGKP